MSLLLLGPRYHVSGKVGGIVVPFELLVETLAARSIEHQVIDLNKRNYESRFLAMVQIYLQFVIRLRSATHVSLHGTRTDFIFIAPLIVLLAKIFGKHVSLRKFAGGFHRDYEAASPPIRWVIRQSLSRADIVFFETSFLTTAFKRFNDNTHQLRNPRKASNFMSGRRPSGEPARYVFAGHVSFEKGAGDLCKAAALIGQAADIHFYGDVVDSSLQKQIDLSPATYMGRFSPEKADEVLARYDALILPTRAIGEGYPGVIIEAFAVGLPVVASDVPGIAELVEEGANGLLVPLGDVGALASAMLRLAGEDLDAFSQAARTSFTPFENDSVTDGFLELLGFPMQSLVP